MSIEQEASGGKDIGCPLNGCDIPVDITFRSIDGVDLGFHTSHLETYADSFPASDMVVDDGEPVPLTEKGSTLQWLFQMMHKRKYDTPDLSSERLEKVLELAEAAEKYLVFHVLEICRLQAKIRWSESPLAVLCYAVKHGYLDLADTAAPETVTMPIADVECIIRENQRLHLAWHCYERAWREVAELAVTAPEPYINAKRKKHSCPGRDSYFTQTLSNLPRTAGATIQLLVRDKLPGDYYSQNLSDISGCGVCLDQVREWERRIARRMEGIGKFREYLH
ncbi:hypothetical protein CC2G_008322 [Coprinopsis cinerea AmutBmut pab1-1]|nr:hypothetical protein CC2G_008322 [Coprinopsis cinerea AmutBmut pab1-1]